MTGASCEGGTHGSDNLYVPHCDADMKPYVGRSFLKLEDGIDFYRSYGAACGFDVRLGTLKLGRNGTVLYRYVVCSREGVKNVVSNEDTNIFGPRKQTRKRLSSRISCMARVVLRFQLGVGYVVSTFNEGHTHPFVSDGYRHMMKFNRNINFAHQMFVLNCAKANIGPMKSFRLFKELVGSYKDVGCSSTDFKNYSRDLRAFVEGVDAQILLDKFKSKREHSNGFTFYYSVDESDKLKRLFWADYVSIQNYYVYGDAVSFDATYSTNSTI
ncbi:hypothetical protein OROHE_013593 [Orobanche hederae]